MGGSFGRIQVAAQWGKRIDNYAVYGALVGLHDNGFRNFSPSDVRRFYSDVGYRNDVSEFHLNVGLANNKFGAAATVPPNALRRKAGLLVTTSMGRTAVVGIRSQLTVSPKASLIRTRSGPAACLPRETPRSRGTGRPLKRITGDLVDADARHALFECVRKRIGSRDFSAVDDIDARRHFASTVADCFDLGFLNSLRKLTLRRRKVRP